MITDCKVLGVNANSGWQDQLGSIANADLVNAVQAESSGSYITGQDGVISGVSFFPVDTSAIIAGSTINSVTVVASARQDLASSVSAKVDVELQASPGNQDSLYDLDGTFTEYTFVYGHALTLPQLSNSIIAIGTGNIEGKADVEYLALRVDWDAPSLSDATYFLESASDVNLAVNDGSAYALSSGMTIRPFIPVGPVGVVIGASAYLLNPGGIRIAEPLQQIAGFFVPPFAVHRRKRLRLF